MSEEKKKLTPKQKLFVEKYLSEAHFNGTRAAELAGYEGSRQTLGAVAYENLKKPQIKAEIDTVLSAMTMPSNVVLTRLTEIAEGKVTDFLKPDKSFDIDKATKENKDGLLKKLKFKRTIRQKKTEVNESMRSYLAEDEIEEIQSETEIIYEEVEFEMYSAHEALRDLGKHHKLFTDTIKHEGELDFNINGKLDIAIDKIYGNDSTGTN